MIDSVIRCVAELPDRNSPEDWPEAMLVTADELRMILEREARDTVEKLIAVARAAWHATDNSEEVERGDGRQYCIDAVQFDALSEALDALDELPDDRPGYVMHGPAKAEWALMGANAKVEADGAASCAGRASNDGFDHRG